MNLDKMVNSKWYSAFEWGYRLVFLNLLMITIPALIGGVPFLIWYKNEQLGWLVIIAIVLIIFGFIPCFIAAFRVIKAYKEDQTGSLFGLFFTYLWNTFLSVYKLELIMLPLAALYSFGVLFYWEILGYFSSLDLGSWIAVVSFVVLFFTLISLILAIIQLPMIVANFRMKTWSLVKFAFFMAFRYFFKTMGYLFLLIFPLVLVSLLQQIILPIYLLVGISGPLYVIHAVSRKQYWYLSHNLDDLMSKD
ncbi:MAG: DUF624 domain-containing protein [Bacilli bacterium]